MSENPNATMDRILEESERKIEEVTARYLSTALAILYNKGVPVDPSTLQRMFQESDEIGERSSAMPSVVRLFFDPTNCDVYDAAFREVSVLGINQEVDTEHIAGTFEFIRLLHLQCPNPGRHQTT
ncbi:hypothetical protein A3D06_01040 [Candidatus Roizmanbacteria bacterium RIFCSPHIGHO2_02_FULL_40_9]|uniref:Uncharacterized protein n=2 Tax=Candidatus Roizmaniibacteriota TaxID=1752723 RepID=A0A1F7IPN0_9BACT|nr:MAG: hypothetical protein A3D06_01040 [Candidatus Roizmanbacteria bacterium RIFCSPHIGHO2_02_FULL_40_9]OGK45323.1 MAG: hypothetical protein A2957_02330 [Candidatus Roizmanbacteria bacterium RIFCSPLOWO2_01_FULL_38_11]